MTRSDTLSSTAHRELEQALIRRRDELLEAEAQQVLASASWTEDNNVSDFADSGARVSEAEEYVVLQLDRRRQLEHLETALRRLADGEYGSCEMCGEAIEPMRLAALPASSHCMSCQRRYEQRRHLARNR